MKSSKRMTCLVDCDVRVQWTSFVMSLVLAYCQHLLICVAWNAG